MYPCTALEHGLSKLNAYFVDLNITLYAQNYHHKQEQPPLITLVDCFTKKEYNTLISSNDRVVTKNGY